MGSILKCIQLLNNISGKKMLKFLLYLALTSTVVFCSQNTASNCPDDEEWIDFTFFNLGCLYIGESRPMTWSIAKSFCYGKVIHNLLKSMMNKNLMHSELLQKF